MAFQQTVGEMIQVGGWFCLIRVRHGDAAVFVASTSPGMFHLALPSRYASFLGRMFDWLVVRGPTDDDRGYQGMARASNLKPRKSLKPAGSYFLKTVTAFLDL